MSLNKLFLFIYLLSLSGCAGCSKSGRESIRQRSARDFSQKSSQAENRDRSSRKQRPVTREKNIPIAREQSSGKLEIAKGQLSNLYDINRKGVFLIFSTNDGNSGTQGSGFFISSGGLAISNQHVFDGYNQQFVKLFDGTVFKVIEILEESHHTDFDYVIFKVDTEGQEVFPLKPSTYIPTVGEDVFAIGNPKGLEQTLSKGIVSGFREGKNLIQTTTEITNGSSGGPLFNMNGKVVGITTSGVGEANLNFVVNIQLLNLKKYVY